MDENDKLGTVLVDGKVVNLDTASIEELEKIEKQLLKKIEESRQKIDEYVTEDE